MTDFFFAILSISLIVFIGVRGIFVENIVAQDALFAHGYTNVRVTDRSFFFVGFRGCEMVDAARITVVATDPRGVDVPAYVCAGWPFANVRIQYAQRKKSIMI